MEFFDFGADLSHRRNRSAETRKSRFVGLVRNGSFKPADDPKGALLNLAGDMFGPLPRFHLRKALGFLGFGVLALLTRKEFLQLAPGDFRFGPGCCCFLRVGVALGSQSLNTGATPISRLLLFPLLGLCCGLRRFKVFAFLFLKVQGFVEVVEVVFATVERGVNNHALLPANSVGKT